MYNRVTIISNSYVFQQKKMANEIVNAKASCHTNVLEYLITYLIY